MQKLRRKFPPLALAVLFLFTTLHALGHSHDDGRVHHDCSQYLFLQHFSAESSLDEAPVIIIPLREHEPLPPLRGYIYSYNAYRTLFPNAPPVL